MPGVNKEKDMLWSVQPSAIYKVNCCAVSPSPSSLVVGRSDLRKPLQKRR